MKPEAIVYDPSEIDRVLAGEKLSRATFAALCAHCIATPGGVSSA